MYFFFFLGLLRAFLKNSEVIVLTILSLVGFLIGQLAYNFVEVTYIRKLRE